jgi:hypothetical protein
MLYTPGWGAVLGVGGTLLGVAITQAANSLLSLRTSRKERNARMTDGAADLIAAGNAWVYAASEQEQDLFHAIATKVPLYTQMKMLKKARTVLYAAQLKFGYGAVGSTAYLSGKRCQRGRKIPHRRHGL